MYAGAAAVSLLVVFIVMQLWRADFNIPFAYEWRDLRQGGEALDPVGSHDALLFYAFFKGMHENGWYLHNPSIGVPGGMQFNDYPFADDFHFLSIKVLQWFCPNYAVAANLYFLLGFPLAVLSAMWVLRNFKVSYLLAAVGGLLFAFIPYHFLRGQQHLWLASYYPIPLMVLVVFWVLEREPLFSFGRGNGRFPVGITRKGWATVLICALMGSTGVYYTAFGFFFLAMACVLRRFSRQVVVSAIIIVGLLCFMMLLNITPTLLFIAQHGKNPATVAHFGAEAEFFGLKIIQMLLPVPHHRIGALAAFSSHYMNNAPLITENASAALGLVSSVGFLLLLAWQFGLRWQTGREVLLTRLSAMNLGSVLLATIGGFSAILAFGISPAIRCYNRFSIYIAFFALLTILLVLEKLRERWAKSGEAQFGWTVLVLLVLGLGLADQTNEFFVPPYPQSAAAFQSDEHFVQRVEAKLPPGSMIFQLPYIPFPEGPVGEMALLRPYLHSHTLRWSFGAMAGRETDNWVKTVLLADGDLSRMIRELREAGFKGLYIDRQLMRDYEKVEAVLKQTVDPNPIESENGRMSLFTLTTSAAPTAR